MIGLSRVLSLHRAQSLRQFSSVPSPRVFPSYVIFGETVLLRIVPIPPTFKTMGDVGGAGGIVVDKVGRLMLTFTPRQGNMFLREEQESVSLSAEECGLFTSQLPKFGVEFSRRPLAPSTPGFSQAFPPSPSSSPASQVRKSFGESSILLDYPSSPKPSPSPMASASASPSPFEKVLLVEPLAAGVAVDFTLKYLDPSTRLAVPFGAALRPELKIRVQAGEFEVVRTLVASSITHLLGWQIMMERNCEKNLQMAMEGGGTGVGAKETGYKKYTNKTMEDVPF